jgi:hypothetical protein
MAGRDVIAVGAVAIESVPSVRIAVAPPVPIRAVLSARLAARLSSRFPRVFRADLLTGPARIRPKIALRRPILSGPPDWAAVVRNLKIQANCRFQRGGRLAWFEPHLPDIRTSSANNLVRRRCSMRTLAVPQRGHVSLSWGKHLRVKGPAIVPPKDAA